MRCVNISWLFQEWTWTTTLILSPVTSSTGGPYSQFVDTTINSGPLI